jgi:F0F1-type ATP synthase membrane subunit b/b'
MQRLLVALFTVVVFLAGYGARVWTEPRQVVPPAPTALAQEFARPSTSGKKKETDRAKLVAELEKLRPQIESYQTQVNEIYAEFDRELAKILNPQQRAKFEANQRKWAEHEAKKRAKLESERMMPMTEEEIMRARERPMSDVYRMITVTPKLESLTKDYELDPAQQASVRALLTLRRAKFMALLDATPPPSIQLSRLGPLISRVAAKPAK